MYLIMQFIMNLVLLTYSQLPLCHGVCFGPTKVQIKCVSVIKFLIRISGYFTRLCAGHTEMSVSQ